MVALLILAAAVQATQPTPAMCSLVTPGLHVVDFQILAEGEPGSQVRVAPTPGSVWPRQATTAMTSASGSQLAFAGDEGFVLKLERRSGRQIATLSRRGAQRGAVPIAFGFCAPSQTGPALRAPDNLADQADTGAEVRAFDPSHWPEDRCGMLLTDGRRMLLQFELIGPDQVAMASPRLWNGQPVMARIGSARNFSGRNGLSGVEELIVPEREGNAAKLIRFRDLGDPSVSGQSAYAICGYSRIVRRPARR